MSRKERDRYESCMMELAAVRSALERQERRNAELCEEMYALRTRDKLHHAESRRLREVEKLLAALVDAPCTTCDPWDEGYRCGHNDGGCQLVAEAMELGIGGEG